MGRAPRAAEGGVIYHVYNRANGRQSLFEDEGDYDAFVEILAGAVERHPVRLFAFCVLPDHFHMVLRPSGDGSLSQFMRSLTVTHTHRWHARRGSAGTGHVYQGRFRSFPVQRGEHFLTLCRYIERNPVSLGLAERAQDWRWGSPRRVAKTAAGSFPALSRWPVARPDRWARRVNTPLKAADDEAVKHCLRRCSPFGDPKWVEATARRMGLESTLRPRGRPRKDAGDGI